VAISETTKVISTERINGITTEIYRAGSFGKAETELEDCIILFRKIAISHIHIRPVITGKPV
jgi:hypothetical protein